MFHLVLIDAESPMNHTQVRLHNESKYLKVKDRNSLKAESRRGSDHLAVGTPVYIKMVN